MAPSELNCTQLTLRPSVSASRAIRASTSSRLKVPYVAGSRVPSKFKLGPWITSTFTCAAFVEEKRSPSETAQRCPTGS